MSQERTDTLDKSGCDRLDSCPHGDILRQILSSQNEQRRDIHQLKEAIVGTAREPGLAEKIRSHDEFRKVLLWIIAALATPILGAIGIGLWALAAGKFQ